MVAFCPVTISVPLWNQFFSFLLDLFSFRQIFFISSSFLSSHLYVMMSICTLCPLYTLIPFLLLTGSTRPMLLCLKLTFCLALIFIFCNQTHETKIPN